MSLVEDGVGVGSQDEAEVWTWDAAIRRPHARVR